MCLDVSLAHGARRHNLSRRLLGLKHGELCRFTIGSVCCLFWSWNTQDLIEHSPPSLLPSARRRPQRSSIANVGIVRHITLWASLGAVLYSRHSACRNGQNARHHLGKSTYGILASVTRQYGYKLCTVVNAESCLCDPQMNCLCYEAITYMARTWRADLTGSAVMMEGVASTVCLSQFNLRCWPYGPKIVQLRQIVVGRHRFCGNFGLQRQPPHVGQH